MRPLAALVMLLALAGCTTTNPGAVNLIFAGDGMPLDEEALVATLRGADVVVIGEVHDNPVHHRRQARLVRALAPGAVAFEMVPTASEEGIAVFRAQGGRAAEIGPAIGWERMGWPDWNIYRPVFEALGDAYIAGGGALRSEVRKAVKRGAAIAWGPGADRVGLATPLPESLRAEIEDEMMTAHCNKLPREVAARMVEAQRFRDARLARAVVRARQKAGARPVVLITGDGHARSDRGAPTYIHRLAPELTVLTVGQIELRPGDAPQAIARTAPYDFVWFSAPAPRSDPCARLG